MRKITLKEYKELQEQIKEREENQLSLQLEGEDDKMMPTAQAKDAEEILSKSQLVITLDEMKDLQEQAEEKEENPLSIQLDGEDDKMVPTARAAEAKEILAKAQLEITLDEMKELQEQAEEKEENPLSLQLDGEDDRMMPTVQAKEAREILSKSQLVITLDEMKELQKQAEEKEENPLSLQLDGEDDRMIPTAKAEEAKEILLKAQLIDSLDKVVEKQPQKIDNVLFTSIEIGKATINTPTTDKKEAEQIENGENTRDNIIIEGK